eukprot:GHVU01189527.1.p1 GENE.GHVU01189527.1~~GHVU01189527.1.p1  ORF type:complete len:252 (+),score=33.43 GHVU01189527.1:122-877(+)
MDPIFLLAGSYANLVSLSGLDSAECNYYDDKEWPYIPNEQLLEYVVSLLNDSSEEAQAKERRRLLLLQAYTALHRWACRSPFSAHRQWAAFVLDSLPDYRKLDILADSSTSTGGKGIRAAEAGPRQPLVSQPVLRYQSGRSLSLTDPSRRPPLGGCSRFVGADEFPEINDTQLLRRIFIDNGGCVPSYLRLLAYDESALVHHMETHKAVTFGSSVLSPAPRHYLAMMAAARHSCEYLARLELAALRREGGG